MSDPDNELRAVAVLLADQGAELTEVLVTAFVERIAELPRDPMLTNLMYGSSRSNLEALAHLLQGHMRVEELQAPSAAVEYARRLAQRGTPPSALLRAYRIGQQLVLGWAGDEIAARVPDRALALQTVRRLTEISFDYIDAVSEGVVAAYQEERERWLTNRSAVQREIVESLLRGDRLDLASAEAGLGYRLRQHHLGLVLWTDPDRGSDLASAEKVVAALARQLEGAGQPLFLPRDRESAWAWIPFGRSAHVDPSVVEAVVAGFEPPVHVAFGVPAAGEPGFQTTHEGAVAAQQVAQLGGHPPTLAHSYADPTIRTAALLARDLPATRRMVRAALGELADDSQPAARMRETLLAFLEERESYVTAAARMHLHKNTVRYRVEKALETRGRPLGDDRLELELGLIACKWLGAAVLPILGT